MRARTYSTVEAAHEAGVNVGQLRQWLHAGVIELLWSNPDVPQRWCRREVTDLVAIADVMHQAGDAGLRVTTEAIRDMWTARAAGKGWRVTLDTGKVGAS